MVPNVTFASGSSSEQVAILVSPSPVDLYPPVQNQARILANAGVTVHLLTASRAEENAVCFAHPGVSVELFATQARNPFVRRVALAALAGRLAYLTRGHPALEIDFDPVGIVASLWARRFSGRRSHYLIHHHHEILFPDRRSRFDRPARLALGEADVVVVADENRARLMEAATPSPRSVMTVRNAPLASTALAQPVERTHCFSVVYFGSAGRTQALDTVVRSMPLWPAGARFHLYGAPRPSERAELQRLASEVGVADRLAFEGWVDADQLLETVARHHVAVTLLRPLNDNWRFSAGASNKRFQAMAAGLPQITDNGEAVIELVEGNGVGVCVPPDDPSALGVAIATYAADLDRIEAEGARGRQIISSSLNYESEFSKVLKFAQL